MDRCKSTSFPICRASAILRNASFASAYGRLSTRKRRHRTAVDQYAKFREKRWDQCFVSLGRFAQIKLMESGVGTVFTRLRRSEDAALT